MATDEKDSPTQTDENTENPPRKSTFPKVHWITIGIFIVLLVISIGYAIPFFGFDLRNQSYRTLWDWLELIVVPAALLGFTVWFNRNQAERDRKREQNEKERERLRERAERKREREREEYERQIAFEREERDRKAERKEQEARFQQEAVNLYYDAMTELLLKEKLREKLEERAQSWKNYEELKQAAAESEEIDKPPEPKEEPVIHVARARTINILRRVDKDRRNDILDFLRDSEMYNGDKSLLQNARMSRIDLRQQYLWDINLRGAVLSNSKLQRAYMFEVQLQGADLRKANMQGANLISAQLQFAHLEEANLQGVLLYGANMQGANLTSVEIKGAFLNVKIDDKVFATQFDGKTVLPDGRQYNDAQERLDQLAKFGAIVEPISREVSRQKHLEMLAELGIEFPEWL